MILVFFSPKHDKIPTIPNPFSKKIQIDETAKLARFSFNISSSFLYTNPNLV